MGPIAFGVQHSVSHIVIIVPPLSFNTASFCSFAGFNFRHFRSFTTKEPLMVWAEHRPPSLVSPFLRQNGASSYPARRIGLCSLVRIRRRALPYPSCEEGMEVHQPRRTCLLDQRRQGISPTVPPAEWYRSFLSLPTAVSCKVTAQSKDCPNR